MIKDPWQNNILLMIEELQRNVKTLMVFNGILSVLVIILTLIVCSCI